MSEPIVSPGTSGQELQLGDVDVLGAVAGLSDDRVFAELLRMAPYDGTNQYKAILPFSQGGVLGASYAGSTVVPSGSANGSVTINPFRAIVGSRNQPSGAPSPNPAINYQSNALANWRDIRSGIFIGSTSALQASLQFAANSSGNPRWDLVYASISVDANGPTASRRVKAASSGNVTVSSVPQWLASPVTVAIVQGTPGATPSLPAVPTDSGGVYNFPLAYVRIINGFTTSNTLSTRDIRSFASSTSRFRTFGPQFESATGNNDLNASYATWFPWVASSSGVRPGPVLPPDWVGHPVTKYAQVDCSTSDPSHTNGAVVDASIDWRRRIVKVTVALDVLGAGFASDPTASGNTCPSAVTSDRSQGGAVHVQLGNSFLADGAMVAGASTILYLPHSYDSNVGSGATIGFYVPQTGGSAGQLLFFLSGSPAIRFAAWIEASPVFPNY